jgi:hypothetical protein
MVVTGVSEKLAASDFRVESGRTRLLRNGHRHMYKTTLLIFTAVKTINV